MGAVKALYRDALDPVRREPKAAREASGERVPLVFPRRHLRPTPMPHLDSPQCWCQPELLSLDPFTGEGLWLHRGHH